MNGIFRRATALLLIFVMLTSAGAIVMLGRSLRRKRGEEGE